MSNTTQVLAENITAGMNIIPTGRTQPVEVLTADNWTRPENYQFGCYGKGFTVHNAPAGSYVTVVN